MRTKWLYYLLFIYYLLFFPSLLCAGMIWEAAGRSGTAWWCTGTPLTSAVSVRDWAPSACWWTAPRERLAVCHRADQRQIPNPGLIPFFFFCMWAAAGRRSGDPGPGHLLHSVPVHVGSHPHCPGAVLPARPQVQHQEHPLKHSGGHVFVWAGVPPRYQSDWTAGSVCSCRLQCVIINNS